MDARQQTLELIARIAGVSVDQVEPEAHLVADLGIDSARALHLLVKLEDELGIELADDDVAGLQTVDNILEFIGRHHSGTG